MRHRTLAVRIREYREDIAIYLGCLRDPETDPIDADAFRHELHISRRELAHLVSIRDDEQRNAKARPTNRR